MSRHRNIAVALLLASLSASAQNFQPVAPVNPANPVYPSNVLLADFNNDGRGDLLTLGYPGGVSNVAGATMSIYLGNGDGTFATTAATTVKVDQCDSPRAALLDGFDVSHSLNVLVLCGNTLQLWHAATGSGTVTFSTSDQNRQVITLPQTGMAMAIGDFNASGGPGVAVLTTNGSTVGLAIYPQVQCGANCIVQASFLPLVGTPITADITAATLGIGFFPAAITAASVQGSAAQAVVVVAANTATAGGGRILPFLYNLTSSVLEAKAISTLPSPYSPYAVASADFDSNGTADLVVGGTNSDNSNAGFLTAFSGKGDGTFTPFRTNAKGAAPITQFGPQIFSPAALAVADLNGDGFPDILSGAPMGLGFTSDSDKVYVTPSNGDGTFGGAIVSTFVNGSGSHDVGGGVGMVSIGHIDNDGAPDFLATDIVGVYDPSSFSTSNFSPYADAVLQSFIGAGRQFSSTVSLTATSTNTGAVLTATLGSSQQKGFVQFFDATMQTYIGSAAISGGTATFTASGTGSHFFIAYYYGNSDYFGSASQPVQVGLSVVPVATTTTLISSASNPYQGTAVTFTATVTPASGTNVPIGTVTFSDGANVLGTGTLDGTGKTTYSSSALAIGVHTITAVYAGAGAFSASTSSATTVTVKAPSTTTTTLTATSLTPAPGASVMLTAKITSADPGTPSGTVTFKEGTTMLGTGTLVSGSATFTTSTLSTASHTITAVYSGDASFAASTSTAITVVVTPPQSATTTTVSANTSTPASGASVTFTAGVSSTASGTPTGTVTFKDGATTLGTATLAAASATFTTTTLATGAHAITAVYAGDTAFLTSTSSPLTITVAAPVPPDFTITVNPSSLTVRRGQSVTATFTVTPTGGFTGTIAFSCAGLPVGATCTFVPPSVTADGSNKVLTSVLTLSTIGASVHQGTQASSFTGNLFGLLPAVGLGLLLTLRRRKSPLTALLLVLLTLASAAGISGCADGGAPATPLGTSSVSITAGVSGGTSHSAALSVTVTD